ncbi:Cilia- and flagella-associated protein 36 [Clarias magur]|uniref:Cilia- and flagella-associated protein 36 n=1 Tax=Clarias magur TaxID=1594786 RepID=A0A8J4TS56_CLAMG|nr:Cilia- and flagella-associated protein 36 [Clarias magur]
MAPRGTSVCIWKRRMREGCGVNAVCEAPLAPWRSVRPRCHTLGTAALAQGSERLPSSSRGPARGHRVTQETQQREQTPAESRETSVEEAGGGGASWTERGRDERGQRNRLAVTSPVFLKVNNSIGGVRGEEARRRLAGDWKLGSGGYSTLCALLA